MQTIPSDVLAQAGIPSQSYIVLGTSLDLPKAAKKEDGSSDEERLSCARKEGGDAAAAHNYDTYKQPPCPKNCPIGNERLSLMLANLLRYYYENRFGALSMVLRRGQGKTC